MRPTNPLILLSLAMVLAPGTAAMAEGLESAAIQAEPQYYLMSLPRSPVGEIAEAVLGEALGLPFKVDEDVDAEMRFEVAGVYGPKALAEEFGYRLWNVDVALIKTPSDGLWLIPKAELATARAQGAILVPPLAETSASDRKQTLRNPPLDRTREGERSSPGWSWLAWLITGWVGGAATLLGWLALRGRKPVVTPQLSPPAPVVQDAAPDDFIIPTFVPQSDPAPQPKKPPARI